MEFLLPLKSLKIIVGWHSPTVLLFILLVPALINCILLWILQWPLLSTARPNVCGVWASLEEAHWGVWPSYKGKLNVTDYIRYKGVNSWWFTSTEMLTLIQWNINAVSLLFFFFYHFESLAIGIWSHSATTALAHYWLRIIVYCRIKTFLSWNNKLLQTMKNSQRLKVHKYMWNYKCKRRLPCKFTWHTPYNTNYIMIIQMIHHFIWLFNTGSYSSWSGGS